MRSPEIDLPAERKTDTLDTQTAISSEERTAIQTSNGPDSLEVGGQSDNTPRGRRPDASRAIGSDHSQDLLSLPASTLGVCRQPRQEPFSEQTPVIPAVGILRREDEEPLPDADFR